MEQRSDRRSAGVVGCARDDQPFRAAAPLPDDRLRRLQADLVLYDSNRTGVYQMYAYRLADRVTARLSSDATTNSQFGSFEEVPT